MSSFLSQAKQTLTEIRDILLMFVSFDIQAAALYLMCDSTVRQQATFFCICCG